MADILEVEVIVDSPEEALRTITAGMDTTDMDTTIRIGTVMTTTIPVQRWPWARSRRLPVSSRIRHIGTTTFIVIIATIGKNRRRLRAFGGAGPEIEAE
jgi:hypothetical protein